MRLKLYDEERKDVKVMDIDPVEFACEARSICHRGVDAGIVLKRPKIGYSTARPRLFELPL